jgi:hypothetical protein
MITTRESINYQFSLIFGYSSPNDIVVGDVIGPGNLTKEKVNELSVSVIKFLRMYNAILRDYAGSEVFSIEFELFNLDEGAQINIYPKSMILVPGRYKDCESLLLALKPETGYLNPHLSKGEIDNISALFFEVEEFTDRPDLIKREKEQVYKRFASRFGQKLFGELIEDKWNKKLIGLNEVLPTEKEMLNINASIKSKIDILWYKKPYEMSMSNPKFERIRTPFEGQTAIDHLKFSISEPSANFIIENTLKLGNNLMDLANTGTIDETMEDIISYLLKKIMDKIEGYTIPNTAEWLINEIFKILGDLESILNRYFEYTKQFIISGEKGTTSELLTKFKSFIIDKSRLENDNFEEIGFITIKSIRNTIIQKDDMRAIDLASVFNFFEEVVKSSFNLIRKSLSKYFSRRRLKTLTIEFIEIIKKIFDKEDTSAKNLGHKFMEKFNSFIFNQIEINPILLSKNLKFSEIKLIREFKNILNENILKFFETKDLSISDLVSFAESLMENNRNLISSHIEKFKKFSSELHFLLSYLLRYSTINRYLKEEPDQEISDPVTFANRFHRFLEKRIGGINLVWKLYILNWIKDYSKKFFKSPQEKNWNLEEIYYDFISYFEEREKNEQKTDMFLNVLDGYIAQVVHDAEKQNLVEFIQQFEFINKIKGEFPIYIKKIIEKQLETFNPNYEMQIPKNFIVSEDGESFYNYLIEMELKYFSKLIPIPKNLILKHNLTNEERELFKSDLFHIFSFRFWGSKNLKVDLSDNFKEVYREWVKVT